MGLCNYILSHHNSSPGVVGVSTAAQSSISTGVLSRAGGDECTDGVRAILVGIPPNRNELSSVSTSQDPFPRPQPLHSTRPHLTPRYLNATRPTHLIAADHRPVNIRHLQSLNLISRPNNPRSTRANKLTNRQRKKKETEKDTQVRCCFLIVVLFSAHLILMLYPVLACQWHFV